MTFLSPLYLLGAVGVLAPVLIHLFGRRRPRRFQFPSLRLLRAAQQQRRSPIRLRRILALLMRMAAVVLLSLALAGPVTRAGLLRWLAAEQAEPMLLLDTSASMNCRPGSSSFLSRAQKAAEQIVGAMPAGARLLLAGAASRLRPLRDVPVSASEADRLIRELGATEANGSLSDCVLEALSTLESARRVPGRIYLMTDLQATSLGPLPRGIMPRTGQVIVVDVGEQVQSNTAVTEMTAVERPALRGRPLRLRARVEAWGKPKDKVIPLTLSAPPLASVSRGVSPRPGSAAFAEFEVTPGRAGALEGKAEAPADAFRLDDERLFAEHVLDAISVLIVGTEPDSRYLRAALNPFPPGDRRSVIHVERVEADALAETDLTPFDVVILADAKRLSEQASERLAGHIATGAGALLFTGPGVQADAYDSTVLPALSLEGLQVSKPVELSGGAAITDFETSRAPLAAFASPLAGDLMGPRFTSAREVSVRDDAGLIVLARFEDGTPALIEAAHERGRAILFNTSAGAAWSDLVRRPVYVPLLHRLAHYLAQGRMPQVASGGPGEVAVGLMPVGSGPVEVRDDAGHTAPLRRDKSSWSFAPEHRGTYIVRAGGKEVAAFAVNLDRAESDPTRLTATELSRRLAPLDVVVVKAAELPDFLRRPMPTRTEVSALLALLALLILAVESVYSLEPPREETEVPGAQASRRRGSA